MLIQSHSGQHDLYLHANDDYRAWLKGGSNGKGHDSTYLKLKAATNCGDPKMLANAMKSYPGVEDVNTMA